MKYNIWQCPKCKHYPRDGSSLCPIKGELEPYKDGLIVSAPICNQYQPRKGGTGGRKQK